MRFQHLNDCVAFVASVVGAVSVHWWFGHAAWRMKQVSVTLSEGVHARCQAVASAWL